VIWHRKLLPNSSAGSRVRHADDPDQHLVEADAGNSSVFGLKCRDAEMGAMLAGRG